jgi:hypothetical membrane protein
VAALGHKSVKEVSLPDEPSQHLIENDPAFILWLSRYAILGCAIFGLSILVADFVVPDHDWIADTISDLGAGKYEFIVDIGIYAFAGSLISVALLGARLHLGGWKWSLGVIGLAILGMIVGLVGARNEYGDNDSEGVVIHIYLVYAIGLLVAAIPLLMVEGARRVGGRHARALIGIAVVWIIAAPVFFFLPDSVDGIYERGLGLVAFVLIFALARLFREQGHPQE